MVLEYVFFDDDTVDVVGTAVQAKFPERKPHAEKRYFDMRAVVEEYAAEREQLEVFVTAHVPDGELVGLRLECPYHETLESVGDILRVADVFQVFNDFFCGLDAPENDVRTTG